MNQNRALVALTIGGLMLSLSALAVAFANIGAGGAGFYRMVIASILFYALLKIRKVPVLLKDRRSTFNTAIAGIFLSIDLILWHQSIYLIGPGVGSILTNCQVFFMTFLGWLLLKERPSLFFVISVLLAFAGLYLLLSPELSSPSGAKGVVMGILSGLAYALSVYFLKRNSRLPHGGGDHIAQILNLSMWAALVLLAYAIAMGENLMINDSQTLVMLIIYGVLVQFIGWMLVSRSIAFISLGLAGLILLMEPIITYFIDVAFLNKAATTIQMLGAFLTLFAVYVGTLKPPKRNRVIEATT